jgi:hypothetical protein
MSDSVSTSVPPDTPDRPAEIPAHPGAVLASTDLTAWARERCTAVPAAVWHGSLDDPGDTSGRGPRARTCFGDDKQLCDCAGR